MFTHECFIRRTDEEIIKRLEDIGHYWFPKPYDRYDAIAVINVSYNKCERVNLDKPYLQLRLDVTEDYLSKRAIDCGDNIDLFIAVAAIRDDSPYKQYFIYNIDTMNIKKDTWSLCEHNDQITINNLIDIGVIRKASVSELIEHFKNKK